MLEFERFGDAATPIRAGARIGPDVLFAYEPATDMQCAVSRRTHAGRPTLHLRGENRQEHDWFGIEVMLGAQARAISLTARFYPAGRLYPRLHMTGADGRPFHINLPDQAAPDHFALRRIDLREICADPAFWASGIGLHRLTLLVPPSPWFVLEIAEIAVERADA